MKKILTLIMVTILCFSLAGCRKISKEEMMSQSIKVTASEIISDSGRNIVDAKQQYCNQILEITGEIKSIETDYIKFEGNNITIDVYLPTEMLVDLEPDQQVTVVGKTKDNVSMQGERYCYKIPEAFLVTDKYKFTGRLEQDEWSYRIVVNRTAYSLSFYGVATSQDAKDEKVGEDVTVLGKIKRGSYQIYDATFIGE